MIDALKRILKLKIQKIHKVEGSIFIFTFLVYIHNLSPSVFGGDSGDFLSAAYVKGIAHPSGYPLYTILGILSLLLPINKPPAWTVGLVSSLSSTLSVVLVYLIVNKISKNKIISAISALTVAFTYPFWIYAEVVEVFSLHNFFILAIIYSTLLYIYDKQEKYILATAFFIGLSLTNNLSIVLIFPVIGLVILVTDWRLVINFKLLLKSLFVVILGLLPYLYIPIAASKNPPLNWGRVVNIQNLIAIITRKDYGWNNVLTGYKQNIVLTNADAYLIYLKNYATIIPVLFALLGFVYLLLRNGDRKRKLTTFILFLGCYLFLGPIFILIAGLDLTNYGTIAILERFYLSSIIVLDLIFPFGVLLFLETVWKILKNKKLINLVTKTVYISFLVVPLSILITNYRKTNLSNVHIGENLGVDILTTLPQNALLLVVDDSLAFNTLSTQLVQGTRPDISIPGNHGGTEQLMAIYGLSESEINKILIERHNKIDKNIVYSSIAPLLAQGKEVFTDTGFTIEDEKYGKIVTIPYGMIYQMVLEDKEKSVSEDEYLNRADDIFSKYHLEEIKNNDNLISENLVFEHIRRFYVRSYITTSKYIFDRYKDENKSVLYFQKAKEIDTLFIE